MPDVFSINSVFNSKKRSFKILITELRRPNRCSWWNVALNIQQKLHYFFSVDSLDPCNFLFMNQLRQKPWCLNLYLHWKCIGWDYDWWNQASRFGAEGNWMPRTFNTDGNCFFFRPISLSIERRKSDFFSKYRFWNRMPLIEIFIEEFKPSVLDKIDFNIA